MILSLDQMAESRRALAEALAEKAEAARPLALA